MHISTPIPVMLIWIPFNNYQYIDVASISVYIMSMVRRLNSVRDGEVPQFTLESFEENPEFYEGWKLSAPIGHRVVPSRYWRLVGDEELTVGNAVGRLMFGTSAQYPEFHGIGNVITSGTREEYGVQTPASYLGVIVASHVTHHDIQRTVTHLVEATNEQLLALNSLYRLPL